LEVELGETVVADIKKLHYLKFRNIARISAANRIWIFYITNTMGRYLEQKGSGK
jgi:hypothetical protein